LANTRGRAVHGGKRSALAIDAPNRKSCSIGALLLGDSYQATKSKTPVGHYGELSIMAECVSSRQAALWQLISRGKPRVLLRGVELELDHQIAAARPHAGSATTS
jgi:hypothetical protein